MDETFNRDTTKTGRELEFKYVEAGKQKITHSFPPVGGAGDFVPKPQRSPSVPPTAPPRTRRMRTKSAPPARPPAPCRKEHKELTKQPIKRPPYNPLLNPFKDDMEKEEELLDEKPGNTSLNASQTKNERQSSGCYENISLIAVDTDKKKVKISVSCRDYPETLNPFAGDADVEEQDKKADYDESLNPFAPPPRPPPPVIKKSPQPTAHVPPMIVTSFRKRLGQFFIVNGDKKGTRIAEKDKKQAIKWICTEPVKKPMAGHLGLKKGQKVKQTGPVNTDGFAYGYTKKGFLKKKVWGYFPLTSVRLVDHQ